MFIDQFCSMPFFRRSQPSALHQQPFSHRDKRRGIIPRPHFLLERATLINLDGTIAPDTDRVALQRPRCRSFEVDAVFVKPTTVAWAFELLLRFQPVRRTPKVRAHAL